MKWHFSDDRPIYPQIIEQIKGFIISGKCKAGDRLPSVRELAAEAGVNPNTMQRALSELEKTGLINSFRTNGRFITESDELIELMREKEAEEIVKNFVTAMKELGFSAEQTKEKLEYFAKEEVKNE